MITPGTVSKILWHFTGGPVWDSNSKSQESIPKPEKQAYDNLISILSEKKLDLGNYKEIIKLILPEYPRFNIKTKKPEVLKNVPVEITSSPVCCVADIPVMHLGYHRCRYGRFAIGFKRQSLVACEFNPVFYTIDRSKILQSIYSGFDSLRFIDPLSIKQATAAIKHELSNDSPTQSDIKGIEMEADSISECVGKALKSLGNMAAFVKTFSEAEFDTIYCEREWRSLKAFSFSFQDIGMIVLPEKGKDDFDFFADFVNDKILGLSIPRGVPIIPWETLVEH